MEFDTRCGSCQLNLEISQKRKEKARAYYEKNRERIILRVLKNYYTTKPKHTA